MKPLRYYMRSLHRDLGFFVIGLVVIYTISGILLMYRNTDLLKKETTIERNLAPNLNATELSSTLRLKGFKIVSDTNDRIEFNTGVYDPNTGIVTYKSMEVISPLNKFIILHRNANPGISRTLMVVFGVILFFLAISSFWMFKPGSRYFRRGLFLMVLGVIFSVIVLYL
ncbi:MAG: hypothetical protein RR202_09565 [Bacteroidales bacterium]